MESNEKNRTTGMEIWNRLKATREKGEGGQSWKEGEGMKQRTCMNDLWTRTAVWEFVGVGMVGMGGREQRKKLGQL